jgi:hypothetical protein
MDGRKGFKTDIRVGKQLENHVAVENIAMVEDNIEVSDNQDSIDKRKMSGIVIIKQFGESIEQWRSYTQWFEYLVLANYIDEDNKMCVMDQSRLGRYTIYTGVFKKLTV